jgi:type II secretory pathway predicted ATPase ExeA
VTDREPINSRSLMIAEVCGFDTVAVPEVVEVGSKYHRHFGLDGPPFEFDASLTSPFISTPHRDSLATLEWGLTQTISGLTLLVGEPGVGKTTLIEALMAQHPEWVQESGERAVVIVDEAEELTDANLEDLRLLSNTDVKGEKRLHFILVGRPELAVRLQTPALRDIDRSIGARTKLNPLKFNEARSYVDYRLQRQGGSAQKIFNRRALRCLIAESAGIPRQINRLCNSAMAAAYAQGARVVTLADARAAAGEYRHRIGWSRIALGRRASRGPWSSLTTRKVAAVMGAGLAAAAAIVYLALADRSGRPASLFERAVIVRAAPPLSAGSRAPATSNPDRLAKEAADGTVMMPLRLDSKAVQERVLPSSVLQPVDSGGAISKGFIGPGDTVNRQSNNHFGFRVEPGQTSGGDPRAGYTERAAPDDSSSLPTTERRSSIRHHRRPQNRKAPQLMASPDKEALDNTKPAMDKSQGVARKAPILSLDPNWWVVPSR